MKVIRSEFRLLPQSGDDLLRQLAHTRCTRSLTRHFSGGRGLTYTTEKCSIRQDIGIRPDVFFVVPCVGTLRIVTSQHTEWPNGSTCHGQHHPPRQLLAPRVVV